MHGMTQAIIQAAKEATKAAIQAMFEAAGPTERNNASVTTPTVNTRSRRPETTDIKLEGP